MLKKIGRFIYYNLFLITPLIVLSNTYELFEFNKMNFIYLSALSVVFLIGIETIRKKKFLIQKTVFDLPIAMFFTVMLLSTLFSIDRHTSIFGYYGRFNGGLLSLVTYFVLFYGFRYFFTIKDITKILKLSALSSVAVMIWGLFGTVGHDLSCLVFTGQFSNSCWTDQFRPAERMFSTLGQPNWLGAYLAIHFFIGLYFIFTNHFKRWFLSYGYALLTFICLVLTRSRSAMLAVGIGVSVYCGIVIWSRKQELFEQKKKPLMILLSLFLVATVVFKTGIDKVDNLTQFATIKNQNAEKFQATSSKLQENISSEVTESLDIRKIVWDGAIKLGLRYPVLGTGLETFGYSYYFTRPIEHNITSEWDYVYNKAHNEYLNYFATTGFLGLLSYLIFIGVVLQNLSRFLRIADPDFKSGKSGWLLNLSLLCAYSTILVTNFFGFSTSTINLFFFLIPAFLIIGQNDRQNYANHTINTGRRLQIGLVSIGYMFGLVWLLLSYVADTQYAQGLLYEGSGDYIKAYERVGTAVNLHPEPVYLDKLSNLGANVALIAAYQSKKELVSDLINNSRVHNLKALRSSSKNIQFWKTSAKNNLLYYQIALDKKYLTEGISSVDIAMVLAPTEPKLPYTKAIFYSILADEAKDKDEKQLYLMQAVSSAQQAIQLKSDYTNAKDFLDKLVKE